MENRFEVIARSYERALELYPDARTDAEEVLRLCGILGDEHMLEVTSGSGFLTLELARRLTQGSLVAQDISPEMQKFAKAKAAAAGLTNIRFYVTEDMTLPDIGSGTIDKAACLGGFHHVEEPVALVRGIARTLKSGGTFSVGDFADDSPVQRYFDERIHTRTETGHRGLFLSVSEMENLARYAGLSAVSVERKVTPFIFPSDEAIGVFYQLVHALDQTSEEVLGDIRKYLGILHVREYSVVLMDYVFAKFRKEGSG